jgi:hypothetical protein
MLLSRNLLDSMDACSRPRVVQTKRDFWNRHQSRMSPGELNIPKWFVPKVLRPCGWKRNFRWSVSIGEETFEFVSAPA